MSDAIKCGKCNYIYWTGSYENWGTCSNCNTNMDHWDGETKPELWASDEALGFVKDPLLKKAEEATSERS